jgi:hypothetical protein
MTEITKTSISIDANEPSKATVTLVISGDTPMECIEFAKSSDANHAAVAFAKKEGLEKPNISDFGIPMNCDKTGKQITDPNQLLSMEVKPNTKYYYTVSKRVLGDLA